jgi:murein L,D-transpeptidase YcbB/YkuD
MATATYVCCIAVQPVRATQVAPAAALAPAIEAALATPGSMQIDDTQLDAESLRAVYVRRGHTPLWMTGPGSDERIRAIAAVLADAASNGLDPHWYHTEAITRRLGTTDVHESALLELLVSDAVLLYAQHQKRGASPPAAGHLEIAFDQPPLDREQLVVDVASAADPAAHLRSLAPPHESYRRLRSALALYRRLEHDGGWAPIPEGPTLRVGMSSAAVPALRRRLAVTGELGSAATESTKYDATLAAAVKVFQQRNGIVADGVVGKSTQQALNVPIAERIEEIIVNMERWRWMPPTLGERYVIVNVPAFTLDLIDGSQTALSMPVAVGTPALRTPMFSAEIRQLVFNPSWLVPPKIVREEILPKAKADAHYLSKQGYRVRRVSARSAAGTDEQTPNGRGRQSTQAVDRLLQAPGPQNPLGRVKFNMPNAFGVYLHDTPSRGCTESRLCAAQQGAGARRCADEQHRRLERAPKADALQLGDAHHQRTQSPAGPRAL